MSRYLNWCRTPQCRKAVLFLTGAASLGAFFAGVLPKSVFLEQYCDFVTMRKYDVPVPVSSHLQKLWAEVLDDLNVVKQKDTFIKPFTVFGFDVYHNGSLKSKYGAIIGLPINFTYTDIETIDKENILLNNEPVDWCREDAMLLLESFILSDDAKKYAMAREILMTNNHSIAIQAIANSTIILSAYFLSSHLNNSFFLFEKPRTLRILLYTVIIAFFWGFWAMQKDALTRYYESETDEYLAQLKKSYSEGAIEFYNKLLTRNIALRSLFGKQGELLYTAKGNHNYIIRLKNLPITHRKEFFEKKLK